MSMVAARAVVLGGMMLGTSIRSGPHRPAFHNKSLHPAPDTMDSLQGQLLIASTGLLDPNFARTVILVAAHGEEGALGLILNREMSVPLQQVWGQVSELPCLRSGNVRHGGPVGGTLMALHDLRIHANLVVTDDVFVATELSAMESLASSDDGLALFYIGHSGWGLRPARERAGRGIVAGVARQLTARLRGTGHQRTLEGGHDRGRPPTDSVDHPDQTRTRRAGA